MASPLSERDWQGRLEIYHFFVAHGRPPTTVDLAARLAMSAADARALFRRLHGAHAIFLSPGTDTIRMANPLSAVTTDFRVTVGGRQLYANCAWDSLGIPAMLQQDAVIDAAYSRADDAADPARYAVVAGALTGDTGFVHFPLPYRSWYDDLIHT